MWKNFCQQYIDGICIHCYDGYYLNDQNKCIEIPISKCRQYDGNTEKCTVCLDGSSPRMEYVSSVIIGWKDA